MIFLKKLPLKDNSLTLADPPQGTKIIGSMWTFKIYFNDKENIMPDLSPKYSQEYSIDYDVTFALVVSYATIRNF